jgi:hypothetical protein
MVVSASRPAVQRRPLLVELVRLRALAGLMARTAGAGAARRALPTYLALFVTAAVVFPGNGLRSSQVVQLALAAPASRFAMLAIWLLLGAAAARAVFTAPGTSLLRTWPVPRWHIIVVLLAYLAVVECPWTLLWLKGRGPAAGLAALVVAIAGHGLLMARPRRWYEWLAAGVWLAALWELMPVSLILTAAAALPAAVLGTRRAWLAAPEHAGARPRNLVPRSRWAALALALSHLATLLRGQRPAVARFGWFSFGGALGATLAVTSNRVNTLADARAIWRVATTFTSLLAATGVLGALVRTEIQARWLLDVCGTSTATRRAGLSLAIILLGTVFSAAAGVAFSFAWPGPWFARLALVAEGGACGLAAAAVAAGGGRWAVRGSGHDSGRLVAVVMIGGLILVPLSFWAGLPGLLVVAVVSALLPEGWGPAQAPVAPPTVVTEE